MFKFTFLFIVSVTITLNLKMSRAECCRASTIIFKARVKTCNDFYGASNKARLGNWGRITTDARSCQISLCNDGRPLGDSSYCGNGPCNMFGCNCDDGCKTGNKLELFKLYNKDDIEWAKY